MRQLLIFALVALMLQGCTAPVRVTPAAEHPDLRVAYRRPGASIGGAAAPGTITLPQGRTASFVAVTAISQALASYRAQVISPDVMTLRDNDDDVIWNSDIGYIPVDLLGTYNAQSPPRRLEGSVFGIQFKGRVRLVDNEMRYAISAYVMERGAGEQWKGLASQDFDGAFFVRDVITRLSAILAGK